MHHDESSSSSSFNIFRDCSRGTPVGRAIRILDTSGVVISTGSLLKIMDTIDVSSPPQNENVDTVIDAAQSVNFDSATVAEVPRNTVMDVPATMRAKLESDRVTLRRDQLSLQQMQALFNFILGILMLFIFFIFLALVAKGTQDMAQALQDLAKVLTAIVRDETLRHKFLEEINNSSIDHPYAG